MVDDDFQLPDAFVRELKRQASPMVDVPQAVDEAVLASARTHLRRRRAWRAWVATAAAVGLAATVGIAVLAGRDDTGSRVAIEALAADVNRDQAVNILDALVLARQGGAPADVDRLAMMAVQLEEQR